MAEGAPAPSLPLARHGADVEIGILPRQKISWGLPPLQAWSDPPALEHAASRPERHQVPQEV